nr:DUF1772 domain-containing protein [Streptomyces carpinensis]
MVATATAPLVLGVLMPIALLVPINSRVAQRTRDSAPADRKQQIGRWDRFHHLRVGIIITAFVPLVVARRLTPLHGACGTARPPHKPPAPPHRAANPRAARRATAPSPPPRRAARTPADIEREQPLARCTTW